MARYALSFTSGSLLATEALVVAPIYLRDRDAQGVRLRVVADNLLQARTEATSRRRGREVVQRLSVLSDNELALLIDSTPSERGHVLWAAACRQYSLIGEFAEEVLREQFLLLVPHLGYDDFDSFIRGKALWHEELATLSDASLRKLRSNLFRMMIEAGLLTEEGHIEPALLSIRVTACLNERTPSDIRFFPARAV
jgi:hypothetical protein